MESLHNTSHVQNTLLCDVLMQFSSINQRYVYSYINVQYAPSQTSELQLPYIIFHRPNIIALREMNQ